MLTEQQFKDRANDCPIEDCDGMHIPNVPLMRKITDYIKANPQTWYQRLWAVVIPKGKLVPYYSPSRDLVVRESAQANACGTAYCIAGHAAMMSEDPLKFNGETPTSDTVQGYTAPERARHELGLSSIEAGRLFSGDNSWGRIKKLMNQYAALVDDVVFT